MSWTIDTAHSQINFAVRHMMITNVRGRFENFSGTLDFNEQDPTQTQVEVQIEAASINTNDDKRDGHLRSADFFNVEEYPHLTFRSTKVELVDSNNARLHGDLTIRGVSRPVMLEVEYMGQAKSPWGAITAGFSARTKINRHEWGLNWNVALETGGLLVGDMVTIDIDLEIVQQPEAELVAAAD